MSEEEETRTGTGTGLDVDAKEEEKEEEEKEEEEEGDVVLQGILSGVQDLEGFSSDSDSEGEEHIQVPSKRKTTKKSTRSGLPPPSSLNKLRSRRAKAFLQEPPEESFEGILTLSRAELESSKIAARELGFEKGQARGTNQDTTVTAKEPEIEPEIAKEPEKAMDEKAAVVKSKEEEEEEEEESLGWSAMMAKKQQQELDDDAAFMRLTEKEDDEEKEEKEDGKRDGDRNQLSFLDDDRESVMTGATDDSRLNDEVLERTGAGDDGLRAMLAEVTGPEDNEEDEEEVDKKAEAKEEELDKLGNRTRQSETHDKLDHFTNLFSSLQEENQDDEEAEVVNIDDYEPTGQRSLLGRKATGYFLDEEEQTATNELGEGEKENDEETEGTATKTDENEENKEVDDDDDDDDDDESSGLGNDTQSEAGSEIIQPEEEEVEPGEAVYVDRGHVKNVSFDTLGDFGAYLFLFAFLAIVYQTSTPSMSSLGGVKREGDYCLGFMDHCGFGSQCEWFTCKKLLHVPHPWLAPVDNQGSCGSCWAIASTHVFNDQLILNAGSRAKGLKLSSQNVMECAAVLDPNMRDPCAGGKPMSAMKSISRNGVHEEYQEPYVAKRKGRCITQLSPRYFPHALGILKGGEENIMDHVYHRGPAVVVMKVHWNFFGFFDDNPSRVYTTTNKSPYVGFHSIEIVGYGEQSGTKFWLAKNTWGDGWADKGYFRILRGENFCDVENLALTTISSTASTKGIIGYREQYISDGIVARMIESRIKDVADNDRGDRSRFVPAAEEVPMVHESAKLLKDELGRLYGCDFDLKRIIQADVRVVAGLRTRVVVELEPTQQSSGRSSCVPGYFDGEVWLMLPSKTYASAVPYMDQYADCAPRWRSLLEWMLLPVFWRSPMECKTRYQVLSARRVGRGSFPPSHLYLSMKNYIVISVLLTLLFSGNTSPLAIMSWLNGETGRKPVQSRSRRSKRLRKRHSKPPRNVMQ